MPKSTAQPPVLEITIFAAACRLFDPDSQREIPKRSGFVYFRFAFILNSFIFALMFQRRVLSRALK